MLLNRAGGNTNPWVLGTGGVLGPHFFSIGDSFAYRLVISDSSGNVGIGTTASSQGVRLDVVGVGGIFSDPAIRSVNNSGDAVQGISTSNYFGVSGNSSSAAGVYGTTQNPNSPGVLAESAGALATNQGLQVLGRFFATGTKAAVVPLQDGQHVLLTAEESTEVWFSDYGTAHLVNGRAVVRIDSQYLQTVNTEKDYHVFLTAGGNAKGALYIDNETPSSFEIRESTGTANIKVSYRIVAKRKDFADERLKKVDAPLASREPTTKTVVAGTAPSEMLTERH